MRVRGAAFASSLVVAGMAHPVTADVILGCVFEGLPPIVMHYPDGDQPATMSVDNRPAIPMSVGSGSLRYESATIDGYHFQFSPSGMSMEVFSDGKSILDGTGACARYGGPENETPLSMAVPDAKDEDVFDLGEDRLADQSADTGSWDVSKDRSAFDDTETVVLGLDSETALNKPYGGSQNPRLIIRCQENTTSLYVIVADYYLADIQSYGTVRYRIDTDAAGRLSMHESTDNKALGLWSGGQAIPFVKQLIGAKQLAMQVTPFNESVKDFTFDLTGLSAAILPLRETCNW